MFRFLGWPAAFSAPADVVVGGQRTDVAGCGLISWHDIASVRDALRLDCFRVRRPGHSGLVMFAGVPEDRRQVYSRLDSYHRAAKSQWRSRSPRLFGVIS